MRDLARRQEFASKLKDHLVSQQPTTQSPDEKWEELCTAMYETAMDTFGERQKMRENWMEKYADVLLPLLEEKRKALIAYNSSSMQSHSDRLKFTKSKLQIESCRCASVYWTKLCSDIQIAMDRGDMKTRFEKIKFAVGPSKSKVAPIKSKTGELIVDKKKQLERWVEHYSDLYSVERHFEDHVPLISLSEMSELDTMPTIEELSKGIDQLTCGKAPGTDAIPAELLKLNKAAILPHLYQLLILCWQEETISSEGRQHHYSLQAEER
ncbi:uncharacterized protein LOC132896259 [Neoarius graeffei]|uniref:uncharacterized protein LOC132896259 n=1 Tax=Neoarius graeffei TaxID=443677 RepID=UPI00298BFEDD|nr:uncharacterized protein LOC132896259 [Neoarius graeffei]